MRRLLPILLLLIAAAPARADNALEYRTYKVEITGTQVHDWSYQSSWPLNDETGWTKGAGSQTIGFRTKRAGRLQGIRNHLRRIGPYKLPPFELSGTLREPKLRATVLRTSDLTHRDRPPVCEGGSLDDECLVVPLPARTPQTCGRKSLPIEAYVGRHGEGTRHLEVLLNAEPGERFTQCAPDSGPAILDRDFGETLDSVYRDVDDRLLRLRRGRHLTLRSSTESDGCPGTPDRAGFFDCAVTEVFVELTRLT